MRKIILISLAACMLASCYSLKRATRDVARAGATYPELIAANCANLYPVKTLPPKVIAGKTIIDTVYQEGETVPCPPVVNQKGDTVIMHAKCPPTKTVYRDRVDTLRVEYENTAKIAELRLKNDQLNKTHAITLEKVTSLTNGRNTWRNIAIGLMVLIGLGVVLKIKRII